MPVVSIRTLSVENIQKSTDRKKQNWRNIIFLPFNIYWEIFLVCTIVCNFVLTSFALTFNPNDDNFLLAPYYFFEIMFLINTVAIIGHRNMAAHRKTRYHIKASSTVILISVLSLLPIYEVYKLLNSYNWNTDKTRGSFYVKLLNIKCSLRIIYGMIYIKTKKQEVGLNFLYYELFFHVFYFVILTCTFAVIWELLGSVSATNWKTNLKLYMYNASSPYERMIISYHIVLGMFTHNWTGIINGVTVWEKLMVMIIIVTGFVCHLMIFFGELTAIFLQRYRHQFEFTKRLKKIIYLLDDWKVDKNVKKRTEDYYKLYWEKRSGINTMPKSFYLLPDALQKEVMLDIFWDALRHSSFFCSTDISFKRSLSLFMDNEFYLPGDYIFKAGEAKNKLVYVVTGVIQLLTEEDNESPILSLSSGTLLGEVAALRVHTSKINIRCNTYCEIQSLDLTSLYKVLLEFRDVTRNLTHILDERIEYARWATSDAVPKYDTAKEGSEKATVIMKLKSQWKFVASYQHMDKKKVEIDWSKADRSFSSNHLATLVLTDTVSSKSNVICLRPHCPFVMDPDSSFRHFLNTVVLISISIYVICLSYPIYFERKLSPSVTELMVVLDLIYCLDLYFQLSTAVKVSSSLTLIKSQDIVQYLFKQNAFILDIVSALPLYFIMVMLNVTHRTAILFISIRFLKINKIFKTIIEKEKDLWIDNLFIRCVKYIMLSTVCNYWVACVLYITACFEKECFSESWYAFNNLQRNLTDRYPFKKTLFFTVSMLMNINLSDYAFFSISDIYMSIPVIILSYLLISFTLAELTASSALLIKEIYKHQDEIVMFKVITKRRFVHKELKTRLLNILEFNWLFNEGAEIQGKNGILSEASPEIRTEIINDRFISCFKLVPLLKDCPEALLKKLSLQAEVIILPPDTYVQNINVMSHNVYIILRGYCQMNSTLSGDAERQAKIILKRGDMLAVIETLHRIKIFGSIVSVTAIELLSISYDVFLDIFQSYRSEYMFLQNALNEHMKQYESILLRRGCRLPQMKTAKQSLGRVNTFSYYITKGKYSYTKNDYNAQVFSSLGPWSFFRFLLLRKTINPKSYGYITWEIIRCSCIVIEVIACMVFITVPTRHDDTVYLCNISFRIIAAVDIYLRLHCQYYNKYGVIVKHPLYTALNYIRSSLITDVLTNIPVSGRETIKVISQNQRRKVVCVFQLILRPLQLYRVFSGLSYMESKLHWSSASLVLKTKVAIVVFVILGFLTNILLVVTCTFDDEFENCTGAEFVLHSIFSKTQKTYEIFLQSLYFNVENFTHSVSGVFGVENDNEVTYFLIIACFMYCVKCIVLALYTSSGIGGNVNLSTHQSRMKQFLAFAKDLLLDEHLTKEVVEHYEHVWKETLGTDINVISSKFNLYLRIQFVCFLYEASLRNTQIFVSAPPAIIQRLAPCLKEVHFKRGAVIIRCNDVQGKLYFVHKGEVDITVANTVLTTLGVGGLFGCFHKGGIFRQTFTATGKTHTILLTLDSIKLQEIVSEWDDKHTEELLKNIRTMNVEYMEPHTICKSASMVFNIKREEETCHDKIIRKINNIINRESFWYWLFDYILNVHVAAVTSIYNMAFICIYLNKDISRPITILFYTTDLIFCIKIFLGFHLAYVDPATGLLVLQARKIAIRYLKTDFALDLFSCLPIELATMSFMARSKLTTFNRVCRFLFTYRYYTACKQKLILSKHLRWSFLVYWTIFRLQLMANSWFLVSCLDKNCSYVKERFGRPETLIVTNDSQESALVGYTYTINLFTTTGLRDTIPSNLRELLVSTMMALFAQFMIANMASGFANMIIIDKNTMADFQHKINKMQIFLTGRNLSTVLTQKVWEYYILLWNLQKGVCLPKLISEAPSYLKQDVMLHLFGYHLENHFLFAKTHKDFLRQLVTLLERRVYLPGNVIVEKGDMDSTMYFIHNGEVGAYDKSGNNETRCFIRSSDMAFGEAQGLYSIPYRWSYKALSVTFILALRRSVWEYLLKWFPASEETIREEAEKHQLKRRYDIFTSTKDTESIL